MRLSPFTSTRQWPDPCFGSVVTGLSLPTCLPGLELVLQSCVPLGCQHPLGQLAKGLDKSWGKVCRACRQYLGSSARCCSSPVLCWGMSASMLIKHSRCWAWSKSYSWLQALSIGALCCTKSNLWCATCASQARGPYEYSSFSLFIPLPPTPPWVAFVSARLQGILWVHTSKGEKSCMCLSGPYVQTVHLLVW